MNTTKILIVVGFLSTFIGVQASECSETTAYSSEDWRLVLYLLAVPSPLETKKRVH